MRVVRPVIADCFMNAGNIFFQTGTCSLQNIAMSYIQMESPGKQCILLLVYLVINRYTNNTFPNDLVDLFLLLYLVNLGYFFAYDTGRRPIYG